MITSSEEVVLEHFKLNNLTPQEVEDVDGGVDYATAILRARKKPRIMREYSNLDWIPPTSNIVERLFSLTRLTFTDYRKATLPENLESTLYLKDNGDLWDIQTIANIMNNN